MNRRELKDQLAELHAQRQRVGGTPQLMAVIRELEWQLERVKETDREVYLSCPTHCCPKHGCKYGYEACPVATGHVPPGYPRNNGCEMCRDLDFAPPRPDLREPGR